MPLAALIPLTVAFNVAVLQKLEQQLAYNFMHFGACLCDVILHFALPGRGVCETCTTTFDMLEISILGQKSIGFFSLSLCLSLSLSLLLSLLYKNYFFQ